MHAAVPDGKAVDAMIASNVKRKASSPLNGTEYEVCAYKRTTTVGKDGIHFFTLEHGFQGGKARRGDPPPFGHLGK